MHNKRQIPFPSDEIVKKEIRKIVAKGIVKQESFPQLLKNMYKQIGIRFILKDYKEIAVAVCMMAIIMYMITINGRESVDAYTSYYGIIMVVSPLLYCVLSLMPFITSKLNETFEVEMSCKYNIYQIAAFRMLSFSVFCFLLNTIWVLSLAMKLSSVQFVQAFMISITSLLSFSLLFLYVLSVIKTLAVKAVAILGWGAINVTLLILDSSVYHQLLVFVPWYLYGLIICLSAYLYVKKLKEFMIQNKRRGVIEYADS